MVQIRNSRHIAVPGFFRKVSHHEESLDLARRAVELDPLDSRAQLCLAWSHKLLSHDPQATLHAELAIGLNSNDPWTLLSASHIVGYCGHHRRAVELAEQSMAIGQFASPAQRSYAAITYFLAGRYEDSAAQSAAGLEQTALGVWGVSARAHCGQIDTARDLMDKIYARIQTHWKGEQPPTRESICRWLLHMFPIGVEADWTRLKAGLMKVSEGAAEQRYKMW
jgi:hypothetical protein